MFGMASADQDSDSTQAFRSRLRHRARQTLKLISEVLGHAFYLLALGLVVLSGWGAFENVRKSGWSADAAAWIQAAGSIAAIAGAAWIAQSEIRRARQVRRRQQEETAWYVRFVVIQAQCESRTIAADLLKLKGAISLSDVREWRQRARTVSISLDALADRTDHIHPAVSHILSNAKVLIDDLIADLVLTGDLVSRKKPVPDDLQGRMIVPHHSLNEIIEIYDARMRGIRVAMDDGGDALPVGAWAPWDPHARL